MVLADDGLSERVKDARGPMNGSVQVRLSFGKVGRLMSLRNSGRVGIDRAGEGEDTSFRVTGVVAPREGLLALRVRCGIVARRVKRGRLESSGEGRLLGVLLVPLSDDDRRRDVNACFTAIRTRAARLGRGEGTKRLGALFPASSLLDVQPVGMVIVLSGTGVKPSAMRRSARVGG